VVTLDIDSGTWDMKPDERAEFMRKVLAGRDVRIESGGGYAAVTLVTGRETTETLRDKALAKLSKEEREALGLK
jgi:hypothetical protein